MMKIILASPRGFCAGVERAIGVVNNAIETFGTPIYVRHEVVHNRRVIDELKNKGVVFVEDFSNLPDRSVLIFSAHGVSQATRAEAAEKNFILLDATCPLVTKVHIEVRKNYESGYFIIMIGHAGHPEVEGTMGQVPQDSILLVQNTADVDKLSLKQEKIYCVTQTTLSVDETAQITTKLREKYPRIKTPKQSDICYATQNRQDAVKKLIRRVDCLIVIGSPNSSNSKQLKIVAQNLQCETHMIDSSQELELHWLDGIKTVGITAGASAPEDLIVETIEKIKTRFPDTTVEEMEASPERINFPIPKIKIDEINHPTHD